MNISTLITYSNLSKKEFAELYKIPYSTLLKWTTKKNTNNYRECPSYFIDVLTRAVRYDYRFDKKNKIPLIYSLKDKKKVFSLRNNFNWIVYSLLFEHKNISIGQIAQLKFSMAKDIVFQDYFAIISLRAFLNLILNNGSEEETFNFMTRLNFLSSNEMDFLSDFYKGLKHQKVIMLSAEGMSKLKAANLNPIYYFNYIKDL